MMSQILLNAQVFLPQITLIWPTLTFVTLERKEILRSGKLDSTRYQMIFHVRQ